MFESYVEGLIAGLVVTAMAVLCVSKAQAIEWDGTELPAPPGNGSYSFHDTNMWDGGAVPIPSINAMFLGEEENSNTPIPDGSVFTVYMTNNWTNVYAQWEDGSFEQTLDLRGPYLHPDA